MNTQLCFYDFIISVSVATTMARLSVSGQGLVSDGLSGSNNYLVSFNCRVRKGEGGPDTPLGG